MTIVVFWYTTSDVFVCLSLQPPIRDKAVYIFPCHATTSFHCTGSDPFTGEKKRSFSEELFSGVGKASVMLIDKKDQDK